jgi:hypothetical protein
MKNKKLVELGILTDDENSGVSAISLVENPAIEVDFLYFKSEKFVKPTGGEDEGEFIGRCMSAIEGEFPDQEQRLAVCYSYWSEKMAITPNPCWKGYEPIGLKTKNGRQVPNCVKMEDYDFEELDIFGYNTRFFFICPGAEATFEHLISMAPDPETIGMIRSAAVVADRVFEIEKEVIDNASATREQMKEAIVLVDDFYDIMYEIDEELGMVHNVQYMDGHLEVIADYLPEELSIDTAGLPPYVNEIGKKKDLDKFESYTDYPESAKSAAKRALEWRDSHPDQDCGTAVGWTRANQLAKGEPISEETIARIASFARHLQYKDVPYSEGCGGLMVDAWGGPAAIEWASNKLDKIRNEKLTKDKYEDIVLKTVLDAAAKLGWANEEFANAQAAPFAGNSLQELRANLEMQPEAAGFTVYKYQGPPAQRDFCRQMLTLNRWYTYNDIETMEGIAVNAGFGLRGESTYSIWKYKGGPNCKHRWQKYYVTPDKSENKGPAPGAAGEKPIDMENNGYATSARNWVNRSGFSALSFADEEQKIVVGPAMIPDMEIPRKDEDGDIYYVKFSEETIKEIMMKFMKEARTNATNQDHQEDLAAGAYVYESWLVEDPENDKANTKYGFNVPKGTWMVSMKIDDKETWKRVKNGELRGFSVEGLFSNLEEIQTVKQYIKIMKILKD